ncbi:hypothetical protein DQM14_09550, partial [Limosilactobacillus fermentum]|uniref:aryl-sulfate sulfotransferase n=2 Tax=Limosilactobacillus fermentum TaxID=1613 RepID=UPI000E1194A5
MQSSVSNRYTKTTGSSKQKLTNGLYVVMGLQASNTVRSTLYVDNNGVIRGELPLINYNSMRLIMTGKQSFYMAASAGMLAKVNNLGRVTQTINVASQGYTLHHDYTVDSQGDIWTLATSTSRAKNKYVEDQVIKIDHTTGKVTKVINMQDLLPDLYKQATGLEKHSNESGNHDVIHFNAIQVVNDDQLLVSSRETSTIMKLTNVNSTPKIAYMLANSSVWKGIGNYASLLLKKQGNFLDNAGQHAITYSTTSKLKQKGEYYLTFFDGTVPCQVDTLN